MSRSAKPKPSQADSLAPARIGRAKPAGETVLGEAQGAFARAGFGDATLLLRWTEIAGPDIARIAHPLRWQEAPEGATLTLKCETGAILFLQHQTRELIERLNAYLGRDRIRRLKLVAGRLERAPEPPSHPAPSAEPWPQSLLLSEALTRMERTRGALKSASSKTR